MINLDLLQTISSIGRMLPKDETGRVLQIVLRIRAKMEHESQKIENERLIMFVFCNTGRTSGILFTQTSDANKKPEDFKEWIELNGMVGTISGVEWEMQKQIEVNNSRGNFGDFSIFAEFVSGYPKIVPVKEICGFMDAANIIW
jgi:hypothetical protein